MTAGTKEMAADGRVVAFRAIFRREFVYVFHTLRRLGIEERDLEDLTHEVFVTFFRRFDEYDASRPLRPWLFGIAFRVATSDRRRLRKTQEVLVAEPGESQSDGAPSAEEQLDEQRRQQLVLDALDALDAEKKSVLILHDLDGTAMPEIAIALGIPVNTAYSRLRLAREGFRTAVNRLRRRGTR
jgi:RNA polymerase sigma-70 factor (ECF subfamily)